LPWAARLTGSLTKVRCIETTGQETTHELEQPVRQPSAAEARTNANS
jgi:hypothetical protein